MSTGIFPVEAFPLCCEQAPDKREVINNLFRMLGTTLSVVCSGFLTTHVFLLYQAFASYMSAVAADPNLVPALLSVGVLYKSRAMLMEALAAFNRARELKPEDPVSSVQKHL